MLLLLSSPKSWSIFTVKFMPHFLNEPLHLHSNSPRLDPEAGSACPTESVSQNARGSEQTTPEKLSEFPFLNPCPALIFTTHLCPWAPGLNLLPRLGNGSHGPSSDHQLPHSPAPLSRWLAPGPAHTSPASQLFPTGLQVLSWQGDAPPISESRTGTRQR